jgi:6-phosphogluconolactonase
MKLINNDKINYFYGDERCVSYLNKLSNYRMTKLTLFRGLDIKKLKINRIRGESKDLSKEIRRYSEILPSQVDLTLLSMGSDAHIASIFPNSTSVIEYNKKIILTKDSTGIKRITITPRIINSSKKIILICKGKEKGKILFNALKNKNDKSKYPVLLARNAICFIDKHASIPFVK